jgi:hypothetical protein
MKKLRIIPLVVVTVALLAGWSAPSKAFALPRYGGWATQAVDKAASHWGGSASNQALPRYGGW